MNLTSMVCGAIAAAALGTSARAAEANLSNFKPASGADGIIATEGARPWEASTPFDVKLWLDWAREPVERPGKGLLIENRTGAWFVADMHLLDPLSLSIAVPFTIHEHGMLTLTPGPAQPIVNGQGLGDIRITPRLGLLRQETAGVDLAVQASLELPSSDRGLLTTWGEPVAEALISVGHKFGTVQGNGLKVLVNLFGFTAPNRSLPGFDVGAGFGARFGMDYDTGRMGALPSRVFGEVEAKSMPRTSIDQGPTPAEWRAGLSWCLGPGFTLDVAVGTPVGAAPLTPDFRLVSAIGFGSNTCSVATAKAIADKAAAEKAAAEKAAADKAAAEAAERAAAEKAAAEKAAAEAAAAEAAAKKDSDGDGVPDREDNCPNEPGPAANHGCPPAKRQLVAVTAEGVQILQKIQFASGKAVIQPISYRVLDQVAAVLQAHSDLDHVEVQGHTDNLGSAANNTRLSQARAEAVVKYLVDKGVDSKRLVAKGYGPDVPIADNATREGRDKNRRVEFKVVH